MPAVTINGLDYGGSVFDLDTVRRRPVEAKIIAMPITNILVGRDGTRNKMYYATQYRFEYEWRKVPQTTRDALWAVTQITTVFTIVHIDSVTYAVQIEAEDDYDESVSVTMPNGVRYYDIKTKYWPG